VGATEVRKGKMVWRAPEPSCKLRSESRERLVAGRWQNASSQDEWSDARSTGQM
jgi:hypothetical protein